MNKEHEIGKSSASASSRQRRNRILLLLCIDASAPAHAQWWVVDSFLFHHFRARRINAPHLDVGRADVRRTNLLRRSDESIWLWWDAMAARTWAGKRTLWYFWRWRLDTCYSAAYLVAVLAQRQHVGLDQRRSTPGPVSAWMGDRLWTSKLPRHRTSTHVYSTWTIPLVVGRIEYPHGKLRK